VAPRPATNGTQPGHEWLVEFERPPDAPAAFERALDEHLQEVNRHYYIRREGDALDGPDVSALPEGTFYRWLQATNDDISGQTKVPRMSDTREVADGVLAAAERDR